MIDTRNPSVLGAAPPTRRDVIKAGAAAGLAAALLPAAAAAQGGLVALVHTQAAGDNGPIDSMIAALKQLSGEKGFQIADHLCAGPGDLRDRSSDPRRCRRGGDRRDLQRGRRADQGAGAAPIPNTKWIQIFGDPFDPPMPERRHRLLRLLSRLLSVRHVRGEGLEDRQDRLYRRRHRCRRSMPTSTPSRRRRSRSTPRATVTGGLRRLVPGSGQGPGDRHPDVPGRRRLHPDRLGGDRYRHHRRRPTRARAGMVSAISPAQYKLGPKTVIALVALDFGQSLYNEVTKALGPDFKGGHFHTGLGTGVIDFVLSPVFVEQGPTDLVAKAKEVWPEIERPRPEHHRRLAEGSVQHHAVTEWRRCPARLPRRPLQRAPAMPRSPAAMCPSTTARCMRWPMSASPSPRADPCRRRPERRRQDHLRPRRRRPRPPRRRQRSIDRRARGPTGSVKASRAAGVELVHQSFALPPSFTVAEAMEFGASGSGRALFAAAGSKRRWTPASRSARRPVRLRDRIRDLPVELQQGVEIARALVTEAKVLILDEPTAVLSPAGIETLFERLARPQGERRHHHPDPAQDPRGARDRRHGHGAPRRPAGRGADRDVADRMPGASPIRSSARTPRRSALRRRRGSPRRRGREQQRCRRSPGHATAAARSRADPRSLCTHDPHPTPTGQGPALDVTPQSSAAARSSALPASKATASARWCAPSPISPTSSRGRSCLPAADVDPDAAPRPPRERAARHPVRAQQRGPQPVELALGELVGAASCSSTARSAWSARRACGKECDVALKTWDVRYSTADPAGRFALRRQCAEADPRPRGRCRRDA